MKPFSSSAVAEVPGGERMKRQNDQRCHKNVVLSICGQAGQLRKAEHSRGELNCMSDNMEVHIEGLAQAVK